MLDPQLGDFPQGDGDLPFVAPQNALRHCGAQIGGVHLGGEDASDGALGSEQELAAWEVES